MGYPTYRSEAFLPLYMRDGKPFKNCDSAKSMKYNLSFRKKNFYRQSQWQRLKNTQHVHYLWKAGALRISNMILRGGVATKSAVSKQSPSSSQVVPLSIIFDILETPAFQNTAHDGSFQHRTWLYLTEPGCARLCLGRPWFTLQHTATNWHKCFCIYRLKCLKSVSGI